MFPAMKHRLADAKNVICAYCRETTVHGFRYIVEGANIFERAFWIVAILASFSLCALVISAMFRNWAEEPVVTTIETVSLPIEGIQFPSTTVCNLEELQMPRRNRRLFIEHLLNLMDMEKPEKVRGNALISKF